MKESQVTVYTPEDHTECLITRHNHGCNHCTYWNKDTHFGCKQEQAFYDAWEEEIERFKAAEKFKDIALKAFR